MTREEAMKKAISDAESFCNEYNIAPYGNSFSNFRAITVQKFFDSIYQNSLQQQNTALQARIKDLEEPKTCDVCDHFEYCDIVKKCELLRKDFSCSDFEPKQN